MLSGVAILQLFDVQPLREQIIASIAAGPEAEELDRDEVARLIARARHVDVVPSFQCNVNAAISSSELRQANMELMLATAKMNVPTNTVYLARQPYGLTVLDLIRAPSRAAEMKMARRDDYCKQEVG